MVTKLSLTDLTSELGPHPSLLATRLAGKRFWERLESRLSAMDPASAVVLSFAGIEIMDASFADEVFGTLASRRARRDVHFGPIVLSEANATCIDNLQMALETRADREPREQERLRNCVLPILKRSHMVLVGKFEDHVAQSFDLLVKHKTLTARALADERNLNLNAASTRLKTLADLGLALRTETRDTQGKQFIYESLH